MSIAHTSNAIGYNYFLSNSAELSAFITFSCSVSQSILSLDYIAMWDYKLSPTIVTDPPLFHKIFNSNNYIHTQFMHVSQPLLYCLPFKFQVFNWLKHIFIFLSFPFPPSRLYDNTVCCHRVHLSLYNPYITILVVGWLAHQLTNDTMDIID